MVILAIVMVSLPVLVEEFSNIVFVIYVSVFAGIQCMVTLVTRLACNTC